MTRIDARGRAAMLAFCALLLAGCDSLLEVDNPNNVKEEDLSDPSAAEAMANGVLATVADAYSSILLDHGAVSDELRWVGSRDAYLQMDVGNITDPNNEFSDATYPLVSRARWWSDETIARLEQFRSEGTLANDADLGRTYLYGAFIYTMIANHYDDFVIASDRREGGPPVGSDNMVNLYDTAVQYVDNGLNLARAAGDGELETRLLAMRAYANFQKGLWMKLNPGGTAPADPLVNSAAALADAEAFLARVSDLAWTWDFAYSATTVTNTMAAWVNSRLEFRQGNPYVVPTANDKDYSATKITDIIDTGTLSPHLDAVAKAFDEAQLYPSHTALSAREIRLIAAEVLLAQGNTQGFATHINAIRQADGLTPWTGDGGQPSALEMLVHMRQTNLYLMGRRLHDHYRFGVPSVDWAPTSEAATRAGTFFPITRIERESNPNVG